MKQFLSRKLDVIKSVKSIESEKIFAKKMAAHLSRKVIGSWTIPLVLSSLHSFTLSMTHFANGKYKSSALVESAGTSSFLNRLQNGAEA